MSWTLSLTLVWDQRTKSFNQKWEMQATQNGPRSLKAPDCLNWAAKRMHWEDPLPGTRAREICWALAVLYLKAQEHPRLCCVPLTTADTSHLQRGLFCTVNFAASPQNHSVIFSIAWVLCRFLESVAGSAVRRSNCLATLQPGTHMHIQVCLWATLIIFNGSNALM